MSRNLPSATVRKLAALSKRKDDLVSQVQEVEREMLRIQRKSESGRPAKVTVRRARKRKG